MSRANEPAFPVGSGDMRDPTGMSLREYYAGLAMAGIVANSRCYRELCPRIVGDCPMVGHAQIPKGRLPGREGTP